MLIHEIVEFAAAETPQGLALVAGELRWTFAELLQDVQTKGTNSTTDHRVIPMQTANAGCKRRMFMPVFVVLGQKSSPVQH